MVDRLPSYSVICIYLSLVTLLVAVVVVVWVYRWDPETKTTKTTKWDMNSNRINTTGCNRPALHTFTVFDRANNFFNLHHHHLWVCIVCWTSFNLQCCRLLKVTIFFLDFLLHQRFTKRKKKGAHWLRTVHIQYLVHCIWLLKGGGAHVRAHNCFKPLIFQIFSHHHVEHDVSLSPLY